MPHGGSEKKMVIPRAIEKNASQRHIPDRFSFK
jgi:hypothetical protein